MTRKDLILVAVLVNAGLLAVLFITAIVYDTDSVLDDTETPSEIAAVYPDSPKKAAEIEPLSIVTSTGDEVDNILRYYSSNPTELIHEEKSRVDITGKEIALPTVKPTTDQKTVNVTVKRGDSLEKIAKANGTTINAIKKANDLEHERLSIGQVLIIPLSKDKIAKPSQKEVEDPQYYIVKNGDSPWKIAKQFNVKYEDILRLNNLNEEKARNLKIGDRIRVK